MTEPASSASSAVTPAVRVQVTGTVRGRAIDATADASVRGDALALHWQHEAQPWRVEWHGIDALTAEAPVDADGDGTTGCGIELALRGGDVLTLRAVPPSEDLDALRGAIERGMYTVPELTRGLRAMASRRGRPGAEHDLWFAPLLDARRAVLGIGDPIQQLAVLDAARFRRAFEDAMAKIAALREPGDAPRQRAIEAAIEEEAEPLFEALERLALAQRALATSEPAARLAAWRAGMEQLKRVYAAADDAWLRTV